MKRNLRLSALGLLAVLSLGISSMTWAGEGLLSESAPFESIALLVDDEATADMHADHNMSTMHAGSHSGHGAGHGMAIHQAAVATHSAISSGSWSTASTWENGSVPTENAVVSIPVGVEVTVDTQLSPRLLQVAVDGTLRFAPDVNTELWVDTLTSSQSGRIEIGTAANPIEANVKARVVFVDNGAVNRANDPTQVGRGAVLAGPTVVHGAPKTHRITVGTFPQAGDTQLTLSSAPSGWRIGDQLIITGAQGKTSDEVRRITALNAATVTLNEPLALDHIPPKADLNLWVANGTRNVIFESESLETQHRGHIMFMHTLDVDIQNARFYGLGRTDKTIPLDDFEYEFDESAANEGPSPINFSVIPGPANNIRGRYAIHFHRGGTAPGTIPALIKGSVVEDSPGWAFVNHSSNVDMIDNVSYNVQGAGFYTEAGDEVGSMVGNIAIRTVNSSFVLDDEGAIDPDLGLERGDFGNDGDGFWLSGTRVSVIDNVAAGASAHGIIFWVDGLIEPDTGRATVKVNEIENGHLITSRDSIPVWWAPVAEVRDNESYGATVGFRSRYIHSDFYMGEAESAFHEKPPQAYVDTLHPVFDGITVWDSRDGILLNYNERLSVRNARLIGIGHPFDHNLGQTAAVGVGLDINNEATFGPGAVENISIEGYEMGFIGPRHGNWTVNNLDLSNVSDILLHEPIVAPRSILMTDVEFGSLDGTAVAGQDGQRQNIAFELELDYAFSDPYLMLAPDTVTLDGRELYYNQQRPDYVPYPEGFEVEFGDAELDPAYIGKTNQQLWETFKQAVGGELLPTDAQRDSRIVNGYIDANEVVSTQPTPQPGPTATPEPLVLAPSCAGPASSTGEVVGSLGAMQAIGDSIMAHNKEDGESIPDVVGRELGVSMLQNAVGGAELDGEEGIPTLYESGSFSHVLINGGGNDFARECSVANLDRMISPDLNTGLMVDLVNRVTGDGAQAVLMSYFLPRDMETGCEHFPELMSRYRQLGQQRDDVMYVCTLETITPSQPELYFAPDDPVHPSPAGSEAVGKLIADTLSGNASNPGGDPGDVDNENPDEEESFNLFLPFTEWDFFEDRFFESTFWEWFEGED
ncbi:MAG: G8 domain-containing protein [Chloroflexota bacterium]